MKKLFLAAGLLLATIGSAHAATLDFVAEAAGNERGVADGTKIVDFQGTGIDVTLSANGSNSAYFDDVSGGRPAGLGVCSVLSLSAQCNPSSDDNITSGEEVFLSFAFTGQADSAGTLSTANFYDANHYNDRFAAGATFGYSLDGGANWLTASLAGAYNFGNAAFTSDGIGFRYTNTQFYVSSLTNEIGQFGQVPLPAGGVLILTALGGFGFLRRRKNAASA